MEEHPGHQGVNQHCLNVDLWSLVHRAPDARQSLSTQGLDTPTPHPPAIHIGGLFLGADRGCGQKELCFTEIVLGGGGESCVSTPGFRRAAASCWAIPTDG